MKPEELQQYQDRLLKMDSRLETSIEGLTEELTVGGMAVGETDPHARQSLEAEREVEQAEEGIQALVKRAIVRLEQGTFGICEDCGAAIAKPRLDALPYTPFCIACETKREVQ